MAWSTVRLEAVLELIVVLFQVAGVVALCVNRLVPATRWSERGRAVFIIAMVGLGVAGRSAVGTTRNSLSSPAGR